MDMKLLCEMGWLGRAGVPMFPDLMSDDQRWSWWNNNRNKVHNKCNVLESFWSHSPPQSMEKLSSMKLICCCSVAQLCLTLCDPMECSMPGFPVLHHLLEFAQTQVHWVDDAIQPSHCLLSPSPPALNLSQHQGLFQWVGSLYQMANI